MNSLYYLDGKYVLVNYYLTILFGSTPQLAAIITFGSECSILVHNSRAANPKENYILYVKYMHLIEKNLTSEDNGMHST